MSDRRLLIASLARSESLEKQFILRAGFEPDRFQPWGWFGIVDDGKRLYWQWMQECTAAEQDHFQSRFLAEEICGQVVATRDGLCMLAV